MAIRPGKLYVNSPLRLTINLQNESGEDTDPAALTLTTLSPCGVETTYTYLTDAEIQNTDAGDFTADITPDEAGRWFYKWESDGEFVKEGDFLVQYSRFNDTWLTDYGV